MWVTLLFSSQSSWNHFEILFNLLQVECNTTQGASLIRRCTSYAFDTKKTENVSAKKPELRYESWEMFNVDSLAWQRDRIQWFLQTDCTLWFVFHNYSFNKLLITDGINFQYLRNQQANILFHFQCFSRKLWMAWDRWKFLSIYFVISEHISMLHQQFGRKFEKKFLWINDLSRKLEWWMFR